MYATLINYDGNGSRNKCPYLLPYEEFDKKHMIGGAYCLNLCPFCKGYNWLHKAGIKKTDQIVVKCSFMEEN